MTMKTTIVIPEGYLIESFDHQTGEVTFRKAEGPQDKIRTVDDILKDNGLTQEEFDAATAGMTDDEKAYRLIKLLTKSLNEGWEPDWDNSNELRCFPWFYMKGSSGFQFGSYGDWNSASYVGSRLCLKTHELATYAATQFLFLYKQFMVIHK